MTDTPLKIGDVAPEFSLPQDAGEDVTLSNLRPSWVLMFFYPKDSTPGCTVEAQQFSELLSDFQALNVAVFGLSKDTLKRHENFRKKFELTVPLLSDNERDICETYGVWGEKMNYGRKYMGINRTTFLIDPDGKIAHIWTRVKAEGHAHQVLEDIKSIINS